MKRLNVLFALILLLGGSVPVFAACPSGQVLQRTGGVTDASPEPERLLDGPVAINAYSFQCTTTACTFGLYDGDVAPDEIQEADMEIEDGSVASGGDLVILDSPLYFRDGVMVFGSNLAGVAVYTCQPSGS